MAVDTGLVAWVSEALEPLGHVTIRRMMGGATFYLDGVIFAIGLEDRLYSKADADTAAQWDAAGCEKLSFEDRNGRQASLNYRAAPDDVYDDPEMMGEWARLALQAGVRAAAAKAARPASPRARRKANPRKTPAPTKRS